ncbi:MAG TPA: hypothetical protein VML96_05270 [Egibacteraceae bacterium]|nr:hypothetical protein [Egibacteraceae bacterium]
MLDAIRSDDNLYGEALAVALLVVPWLLAMYAMWRGLRRRRDRDRDRLGPLPTIAPPRRPADGEALYTGTTEGPEVIKRVAIEGLFGRGPCRYWIEPGGLVFQRARGPIVAATTVHAVRLAAAHAGRVLARGRVAVVGWSLGGADVDTGFGFDDAPYAAAFAAAVANAAGLAVPDGIGRDDKEMK